jgi:hypothetical protein
MCSLLTDILLGLLDPSEWNPYVVPKHKYGITTLRCLICQKSAHLRYKGKLTANISIWTQCLFRWPPSPTNSAALHWTWHRPLHVAASSYMISICCQIQGLTAGKLAGYISNIPTHVTLLRQIGLHTQLCCNTSLLLISPSCIIYWSHARHFLNAHY